MMRVQDLTAGGAGKVMGYNASLDEAIFTAWATGANADPGRSNVVKLGDRAVTIGHDGTNWKMTAHSLAARTSGTPVTLSTPHSNARPKLCLASTTLFAVLFEDSGGDWHCKSYSISGNTISADQDLLVVGGSGTARSEGDLVLMTTGRMIAKYANASQYHTVTGINISAGVLTKDASPLVIASTTTADGTEKRSSLAKVAGSTTKAMLAYALSSPNTNMKLVLLTDSGTAITQGSPSDLSNGFTRPCLALGVNTGLFMGTINTSNHGQFMPFLQSAGVVGDNDFTLSGSQIPKPHGIFNLTGGIDQQQYLTYLGEIDNDGVEWYACPVRLTATPNTVLHICFIGVDYRSTKAREVRIKVGTVATGLSNIQSDSFKIAADSSSSAVILFADTADYKLKKVNLA